MNSNYDLTLRAKVTYGEQEKEFEFDPYNDCTDLDGLKDLAIVQLEIPEDEDEIDTDKMEVEIIHWGDVPEDYCSNDEVWNFAEAFAECDQELDVVIAALEAGINPDNIDEAYSGQYRSDEDFAEETAEQLGLIDKNANWPYTCIDWERAAEELMQDYTEQDGYYFRCL